MYLMSGTRLQSSPTSPAASEDLGCPIPRNLHRYTARCPSTQGIQEEFFHGKGQVPTLTPLAAALLAQPVPLGMEIGIKFEVQALLTEILSTKRC